MRFLLIFAIFLSQCAFATGPSIARLHINPIAINDEGEMLFKFKSMTNAMGADVFQPVKYGVGYFKSGEFNILQEHFIGGDLGEDFDYAMFKAQTNRFDLWLEALCEQKDLFDGFDACNMANSAVNKRLSVSELKKQYGFDLNDAKIYFLSPGSLDIEESAFIDVQYIKGNYLIAEFNSFPYCNEDGDDRAGEQEIKAYIDNYPLQNDRVVPYDCIDVTGIIVK